MPGLMFAVQKALVALMLSASGSSTFTSTPSRACMAMTVVRMFNHAIAGETLPTRVSTDHDPLFRFRRWLANLRMLQIEEIKSVPYVPVSHLFIEHLIGTVRREHLHRVFFWNAIDLTRELAEFRDYDNASRVHRVIDGTTPAQGPGEKPPTSATLGQYAWRPQCVDLFQIPVAA